jgi:tetratricopeptide (TPR) repeat protein
MTLRVAVFWTSVLVAGALQSSSPLEVAKDQFERGDYPSAIATLSSALKGSPRDARLLHWRSRCYLEQRDYSRAISDAERAVSERPDDSEYRRWLGHAYGGAAEQARSFSLARKVRAAFEQAVQSNPSNIAARRDLEQFYLEAPWIVGGDRRKALDQVNAIAELDPVAGHLARAAYWLDAKRLDESAAEYQRVLDLRPDRIDPYLEVADFYQTHREATTFASIVEQAARVMASDTRLTYYKGVALVLANRNLAEAEQLLRRYLATAPRRSDLPSHADARQWLGRLNEQLGNLKAAGDEYRAALAVDPDDKSVREALRRLEARSRGSRDL